jgi:thymidylate kinase
MIIVLEGLNGGGKTTYATALSKVLGVPIYRPFRADALDGHGFYPDVARMSRAGVPVNSYHEEIYASDVMRVVKPDVILDRSMPSAILYGQVNGNLPTEKGDIDYLFELWDNNMFQAGAQLVWLECSNYEVAKQRCSHEKMPLNIGQFQKLSNLSQKIFTKVKFSKMKINTEITPVEAGVRRIMGVIGG